MIVTPLIQKADAKQESARKLGARRSEKHAPLVAPNLADEAMAARLRDVTRRNAGRRVVVEVDNPKLGAQALAFDYSFLAADFDALHGHMHVIVADGQNGAQHRVTHTIGRPLALDIRRAVDGSDYVVRLRDAVGQLVITFW